MARADVMGQRSRQAEDVFSTELGIKLTVLKHLRVKSTVSAVVDVLEEEAVPSLTPTSEQTGL